MPGCVYSLLLLIYLLAQVYQPSLMLSFLHLEIMNTRFSPSVVVFDHFHLRFVEHKQSAAVLMDEGVQYSLAISILKLRDDVLYWRYLFGVRGGEGGRARKLLSAGAWAGLLSSPS